MRFIGPDTIFFPLYLLSALIISLVWLKHNKKSFKAFFNSNIWINKSLLIDLEFCFVMIFGLHFLLPPLESWIFQNGLSIINDLLKVNDGLTWNFKLSPLAEGILATLVTMISIDFASYFVHLWMHKNAFLKKIHSIHHSAEKLTFLTTHRQHPLEPFILNGSRSLAAAIGLSIFHWFFRSQTPVITIQGLGAGFFIYMFTVNLHHSHIPVHYPKFLRILLISPHVHHLHHSRDPRHHGKNYGVVFSFWDRMFGTYHEEKINLGQLFFGLEKKIEISSYWHFFIFMPFLKKNKIST